MLLSKYVQNFLLVSLVNPPKLIRTFDSYLIEISKSKNIANIAFIIDAIYWIFHLNQHIYSAATVGLERLRPTYQGLF